MNFFQFLSSVVGCLLLFLAVKSFNERFSFLISVSFGLMMLLFICFKITPIFEFLQELASTAGIQNKYFAIILKCLSVCYLGEFVVGICKDCGQSGWGDKVELACRCTLLVTAIPLFEEFLDVIKGMLK